MNTVENQWPETIKGCFKAKKAVGLTLGFNWRHWCSKSKRLSGSVLLLLVDTLSAVSSEHSLLQGGDDWGEVIPLNSWQRALKSVGGTTGWHSISFPTYVND